MWQTVAHYVEVGLRTAALVAFGVSLVILATQWAVRRKLLGQAAWWPLVVRRTCGRFLRPIERRLSAGGHNPEDAGLWLLGIVVVASLLALTVYRWLLGTVLLLLSMREAGAEAWLRLLFGAATTLLMAAIVARVIGLWLGLGRYHRWMRFAYRLTDWLIEPIRRRLPPTGMLDLSPLVAYLLLFVLRLVLLPLKPVEPAPGGVRLTLHVQPRASRTELAGLHGDAIKLRLAAPPLDGAANAELVRFLAALLGVAKSAVEIVSGATGRRKVVRVQGVTVSDAGVRLGVG